MTADAPAIEALLREALDRLDRQEQRTQAIEAALTPVSAPTPLIIPHPPRREPSRESEAARTAARVRELEARVADLEAKLTDAERRRSEAEGWAREALDRAAQAEEQTRHAGRLGLLGRLVAGVAHDFNNLLTVISGNAQLISDHLVPSDPLREPADVIAATAMTASRVAGQLLAFSKPRTPEPCPLDPNAAARVVERTLRRLAGHKVDLDLLLSPGVAPVRADPAQFDQVLLNLVANARDAIAESGVVTLRTAAATVRADRAGWPADRPPGEYVVLTVTDTGCGMTPEVQARVFEPFFTTKGPDGTGIGLATVRDIVRGAGGHVEVESSPGWGTSVRVFWPVVEAAAPAKVPARGETVLLVQDGDQLRDVAAMALQHAGYRVLEAADGEAGEDRARLYAGPIDLLVADVGLPKRNGRELVERLRVTRPGVKVLFLSGDPPPDDADEVFLAKPYTPNQLLEAVRRALTS